MALTMPLLAFLLLTTSVNLSVTSLLEVEPLLLSSVDCKVQENNFLGPSDIFHFTQQLILVPCPYRSLNIN